MYIVQESFLYQHVRSPTKQKTGNKPSILDLIFTNEETVIDRIYVNASLGKSDHQTLEF